MKMELKELRETDLQLQRRGMPAHGLHYEDEWRAGYYDGEGSHPVSVRVAEDHITAEATRWLVGLGDAVLHDDDDGEKRFAEAAGKRGLVNRSTLLGILDATSHLGA